jgi:hypothetical protein
MLKSPPRPILAVILGGILIVVCYCFVDGPVAWFMHCHRFLPERFLLYPPMLSERLGDCIAAGIIGVVVWQIWRRGGKLQSLLLAIAASLLAAFVFKSVLKGAFGRTWPEKWLGDNPSLFPK